MKKMKKKINVMCPICNKFRRLPIPNDILNYERGSLLYYELQRNIVCEHTFTIIVDLNLQVRDYLVPKQRKQLTTAEFQALLEKYSEEKPSEGSQAS